MSQSNPMHHDNQRVEAVTPDPEEILEIQNMDGFAGLVIKWHNQVVSDAENLLKILEGAKVEYTLDANAPVEVVLEGTALQGFHAGVITALALLSKLPFETIVEDVD